MSLIILRQSQLEYPIGGTPFNDVLKSIGNPLCPYDLLYLSKL